MVGSPIRHSRSPLIHRLFAEQSGLALRYERREVQPGTLGTVLDECRAEGIHGLNVTVPLKEEAWRLARRRTPRCEHAGAANTLWFGADGALEADNTDGTNGVDRPLGEAALLRLLRVVRSLRVLLELLPLLRLTLA